MRFSTQCVIAKIWPPDMRRDLEGCGWVVGEVHVHSGEEKRARCSCDVAEITLQCVERDLESPESITWGHR